MKRALYSLNGKWRYSVNGRNIGLIDVPSSQLCVGESTYQLTFDAHQKSPRSFLCFEGITYLAHVTFNGKDLGEMTSYSFYRYDVTDLIRETGNELQVDIQDMNLPFGPTAGWENYGGIIREVYMQYTEPVMIEDTIWKTTFEDDYQKANVELTVQLSGGDDKVEAVLLDKRGLLVAKAEAQTENGEAVLAFAVEKPYLWSPDEPYLYTLTVATGGDEVTQKVGFKEFKAVGQRFVLNGKPLFLKGICRHDCWGDVGHTLTEGQMLKDMRMIKDSGCNFVRLVHYPHHRRIVEIADEIGLLVSEEPGLWWSDMHNPDTVAGALEVMKRIVIRDRNRVSLAFWLCFNECVFTPEFLQQSSAVCKQYDPTRLVSGANCMNIKMTKELFIANGFDFYTLHPYGPELDSVVGGEDGRIDMDVVLDTLNDKPLLFTEWGGWFACENEQTFTRFQKYMLDAFKNPDGGRVLAGSCYWEWSDMYEFNRGLPGCIDGKLVEGLVDMYRNPRPNHKVFSDLLNASEDEVEPAQAQDVTPINVKAAEELVPLDCWKGQDCEAQKAFFDVQVKDGIKELRERSHRRQLDWQIGPVLPKAFDHLGNLKVNIPAGQPLIVKDELTIPVNENVKGLYVLGNVSFFRGWPINGKIGDEAAVYELVYEDGSVQTVPVRNGIEMTTALACYGPSRITPIATGVEVAMRFTYDLNFEHYLFNVFEIKAEGQLKELRIRMLDTSYSLLVYGVTVRKA